MNIGRENAIIEAIYDEAVQALNPNGEECWHCGGEGYTYDCVDGCCVDAEAGCEDCARQCPECKVYERSIERRVRVEILRSVDDLPLVRVFLRRHGFMEKAALDDRSLLLLIHTSRVQSKDFTDQERADSACWVEGLM